MARQPSADPNKLILGRGDKSEREQILEGIEPRHKQIWLVEGDKNKVTAIEQYNAETDSWDNILKGFIQTVSGIEPDGEGEVSQVISVDGPSPSADGDPKQVGIDDTRGEIFWYIGGQWRLISSSDSVEGATQTHHLDPDTDQINNPSSNPSVAIGSGTGNLSSGDYQWAITFVCDWGETTIGESASSTLTVSSGDDVDLTDIPTAEESVTDGRKIYRTQADGSEFYYVDTISDNSTTTYTDTTADSDLGDAPPTQNTTEAHDGELPEDNVAFSSADGHNHDGANSRMVVVPTHALDGDKHSGDLSWTNLKDKPNTFTPAAHNLNPEEGPHTGSLPWSDLEDVPDLAPDPHGNEAHSDDYAPIGHDNTSHSKNYITGATERIRYGAGQLGNITKQDNLQPPVPIDVAGTAVKAYALARVAPDTEIEGTILVQDDSGSRVMKETMVLQAGNKMSVNDSLSQEIPDESMIMFSLDDSDSTGEDYSLYLIVETDIGS